VPTDFPPPALPVDSPGASALGWNDDLAASWRKAGAGRPVGRVRRLDRGWSTIDTGDELLRVRNIGADVAVGDWLIVSADLEKVESVLDRRSAFVRRASFEGARGQTHTIAANVDVVFLVHALTSPPKQRRLERELVLAYDSGAQPVVVLTKSDAVEPLDVQNHLMELKAIALGAPVHAISSRTNSGLEFIRAYAAGNRTMAFLGASGVGKSTLVNALIGTERQDTGLVRDDERGRHTTVAIELIDLPGGGHLIDTPGLRAVSLWGEGNGIERAFADVFDLMDHCRFRDCKHDLEPNCAVQAAIAEGTLDPDRLSSLIHLNTELERFAEELEDREKATDKRGARKKPAAGR
jgi:ribosome biogenesis GTPase / thiamine phosphate phosphatase